jgi:two-component system, NarL family, response regulator NreC
MENPDVPALEEKAMNDRIRIVLVDDHALMRAGLAVLLQQEPDLEVAGEAGTGELALELVERLQPDLVLMDLSMPGMGGLEATRRITSRYPAVRTLIVTVHAEQEYLLPVLEAGGSGYVMKQSADTELLDAIRTVARGDVFLYPSGTRLLAQGFRTPKAAFKADPMSMLSEREAEVLRLTAEGYTASEIGERLDISPKTVDTYRQRFMDKLELKHRSELIRFAVERGLLTSAG